MQIESRRNGGLLFWWMVFLLLGMVCIQPVGAEPLFEFSKRSKGKKPGPKKLIKGRTSTPKKVTNTCRLKALDQVETLNYDAELLRLFRRTRIIDGALNPTVRTGEMYNAENNKDCTDAAKFSLHSCYKSRFLDDFRDIIRDTGISVGSSPVGATSRDRYRRMKNRFVRVGLKSNDLDLAAKKGEYLNYFYIQSWKAEHNLEPKKLAKKLFEQGIRIVQPAYSSENNEDLDKPFAGGSDQDDMVLTPTGRAFVSHLLDQYMLIDVSHVGEKSALEIIKIAKKRNRPVTANHANARGVYNDDCGTRYCKSRNLSDKVICAIAKSGGVIGFTPIRFMFAPANSSGYTEATENDFLEHINYVAKKLVCRKMGKKIDMTNHISIASDSSIDGYDERVGWLYMKMATRKERWKRIAARLKQECSYSESELEKLLGGNLERVYRQALPGFRAPVLLRPKDNAVINASKVRFSWNPSVVNKPKWTPLLDLAAKVNEPNKVVLVIEKKNRMGLFEAFKRISVKGKNQKKISLPVGAFRWQLEVSRGQHTTASPWRTFGRK